ncbi:MAG: hypothetical protein ACE5JU_05385 [Candidatus Binatia bacterium]
MDRPQNREALLEGLFALLLAALFAGAVAAARGWPFSAALLPAIIGVPGFLLAAALSLMISLRGRDNQKASNKPSDLPSDIFLDEALLRGEGLKRTVIIFAWILGLFLASWLLGQRIALPLFVFLYLKVGAKEGWVLSIGLTLAIATFLLGVFDQVIHVSWYEGVFFHWLRMDPF